VRYFSRSLLVCGVDIKSLKRTQLFNDDVSLGADGRISGESCRLDAVVVG